MTIHTRSRITLRLAAAAAAAATTLAAGCTGGVPMNTMTREQARTRAVAYAEQAAAALDPPATLDPLPYAESPCDDLDPKGRYSIPAEYWLHHTASNDTVRDQLWRYWTAQGFTILTDHRDRTPRYLKVETPDGFWIGVTESGQGDLSLGVSSPCIWPNGTPANS